VENLVQRHPGSQVGRQGLFARGQGLQRDANVVVSRGLIAGEGARIAADIGQMRRKSGQKAHVLKFPDVGRPVALTERR